jgi:hypothetical protein
MHLDNDGIYDERGHRRSDRGVAGVWLVFYLLIAAYTAASLLVSSAMLAHIKF